MGFHLMRTTIRSVHLRKAVHSCDQLKLWSRVPSQAWALVDTMDGTEPESRADLEAEDDTTVSEVLEAFTQTILPHATEAVVAQEPRQIFTQVPGLMEWIRNNRAWFQLFQNRSLKVTVLDDILGILNAPSGCWKTTVSTIARAAGFSGRMFAMFPGHTAFVAPEHGVEIEWDANVCSQCGNETPQTLNDADGYYGAIPLLPRFRAMVAHEGVCKDLYEYRWTHSIQSEDLSADYFDGEAYAGLTDKYDRERALKYDIFIWISADGFQPYKIRRYGVRCISAINQNLPPHKLFKIKNLLLIAFIPGPDQTANLQSFRLPVVNEIMSSFADNESTAMRFYDGELRKVRIHVASASGDQPAVCKPPYVAVKFVEHYERYYFKFQPDRVRICRSTIHCLLHLVECLKRFIPLQNVSQYWMKRFVGWLVERLNARNLAAEAMLNTSIFGEAVNIFFSCMFHQDDEGYEIVEAMGGIDMLGPSPRIRGSGKD